MTELKPLKNLFATDTPGDHTILFRTLEATEEEAASILPSTSTENYTTYRDYARHVEVWSATSSLLSLIKANGLDPDKDWWVVRL